MTISKSISIPKVYRVLEEFCKNNANAFDDRLAIYRFLNKLSDTEEFELQVNREFSAYKLKNRKDQIEDALRERKDLELMCGFSLHPYKVTNWQLYLNDELFLDSLDFKIARRIAFDINTAFNIKAAQIAKSKLKKD